MSRVCGEVVFELRKDVKKEAEAEVIVDMYDNCYQNDGIKPVKQPTKEVFASLEDAKDYLCDIDWSGKYTPVVAFRDTESVARKMDINPSKKLENLQARYVKECDKRMALKNKTDCRNFKAKLITCPGCESKINKKYIIEYCKCPLCGKDLRSETTKKLLAKYNENIKNLEEAIENEERNLKEKQMKKVKDAPVKYLVMYDEFANYEEGLC